MPTTGSTVFAAMLPARWAAIPAAAMITPKPFSAARFANSAAAAGVRWALITRTSNGISQLLSCAAAAFTVGQSLSEPMMMATFLVFSINPSPLCVPEKKKGRGAVTPWPYACSFSAVSSFRSPQARRKNARYPADALPRREGRRLTLRPGYAAVPKAIDCIPVPPLNSLFGAKKKDIIIVL